MTLYDSATAWSVAARRLRRFVVDVVRNQGTPMTVQRVARYVFRAACLAVASSIGVAGPASADCRFDKMLRVVVRLAGVPNDSFLTKPRTIYRYGEQRAGRGSPGSQSRSAPSDAVRIESTGKVAPES
jgi:hypothetical protein